MQINSQEEADEAIRAAVERVMPYLGELADYIEEHFEEDKALHSKVEGAINMIPRLTEFSRLHPDTSCHLIAFAMDVTGVLMGINLRR